MNQLHSGNMLDLVQVIEQFKSKHFKDDKPVNLGGRAITEGLLNIQRESVHAGVKKSRRRRLTRFTVQSVLRQTFIQTTMSLTKTGMLSIKISESERLHRTSYSQTTMSPTKTGTSYSQTTTLLTKTGMLSTKISVSWRLHRTSYSQTTMSPTRQGCSQQRSQKAGGCTEPPTGKQLCHRQDRDALNKALRDRVSMSPNIPPNNDKGRDLLQSHTYATDKDKDAL
jgi:hypothetical protein